jgi:hypothetical protein
VTEPAGEAGGTAEVEVLLSVVADRYDSVLTEVRDVLAGARTGGARVLAALPELGVISVSAPDQLVEALSRIEGVEAVERSRSVQLPPPESPLQ